MLRASLFLLVLTAACAWGGPAAACPAIDRQVNAGSDSTPALMDCLKSLAPGQRLELRPGVYTLNEPVTVDRPVMITTAGLSTDARGCAAPGLRCAILRLNPGQAKPKQMPVLISADNVTMDHLIIVGSGAAPVRQSQCRLSSARPIGGGLRVSGSGFTLQRSALRGFTCYTALEITNGASSPTIVGNVIGPNGNHDPGKIWSDGVTIHDTSRATISDNLFIDNTDVQLILGGCRDCKIEGNRFRHSGAFASSSFAELMLQAWPSTSGDFSGTIVRGNSIDCGPRRRCGYGIMIGSSPWYKGRMTGATIAGNTVANAMMAINLDGLTGPVEVRGNEVSNSGGRWDSDCGVKDWPAVNVSPASRPFVRGTASNVADRSVSTAGCLLNRQDH